MTAATVDITATQQIEIDETNSLKLKAVVDLDTDLALDKSKNSNYYYSSGSFNFMLDKSFKPETLEKTTLISVPFLPSWHQGIVSIHGLIIPVIDILAFARTQNIEIEESTTTKSYLLKLEHKDYSPIVFKLDTLPRLINTDDFINTKVADDSPEWIEHYLKNKSTTLASIDHKKLFDQLIQKQ